MAIRPEAAKLIEDFSAHFYREMELMDTMASLMLTQEEEESFTKMVKTHPHLKRTVATYTRGQLVDKVDEIYGIKKDTVVVRAEPTDCECECHYFPGFVHAAGSQQCCKLPGISKGRGIPL